MENIFKDIEYDNLHHLAIARMGEYWVKYILTMYGLDVYTTEIDNKGIDFVVRGKQDVYFDIQVKSIRYPTTSYVFITKEKEWEESRLRKNLVLALVVYKKHNAPELFLIPSTEWLTPTELLKNREYQSTQKSKPEWGINVSEKNLRLLQEYKIEKQLKNFL